MDLQGPPSPRKSSSSFTLEVKDTPKDDKARTLGSHRVTSSSKVAEKLGKFENTDSSTTVKKEPSSTLWKSYGRTTGASSIKDRMNKYETGSSGADRKGKREVAKKEGATWKANPTRSLVQDKLQSFGGSTQQKSSDPGAKTAAERRSRMSQRQAGSLDSSAMYESQEDKKLRLHENGTSGRRKGSVENLLDKFDQPQTAQRHSSLDDRTKKFESASSKDRDRPPPKLNISRGFSVGDRKKAFESQPDEPARGFSVSSDSDRSRSSSLGDRKRSFELLDSTGAQSESSSMDSGLSETLPPSRKSSSMDSEPADRDTELHIELAQPEPLQSSEIPSAKDDRNWRRNETLMSRYSQEEPAPLAQEPAKRDTGRHTELAQPEPVQPLPIHSSKDDRNRRRNQALMARYSEEEDAPVYNTRSIQGAAKRDAELDIKLAQPEPIQSKEIPSSKENANRRRNQALMARYSEEEPVAPVARIDQEAVVQRTQVESKPSVRSSETEFALNLGDVQSDSFAPEFLKKIKSANIDEGGSAVFSCQVDAEPAPVVTWQRDGKQIAPRRGHFKIGQDGNTYTLEVLQAEVADSGRYTCVASNALGQEECFTSLVVRKMEASDVPDFRSVLKTKAEHKEVRERTPEEARAPIKSVAEDKAKPDQDVCFPPKFVKKMKSVNIDEGGSAQFSCQVDGEPVPVVAWQKDGKPLAFKRGRFKISQDDTSHMFEIMQAEVTDSGRYTCMASNMLGQEKCSTALVVRKKEMQNKPDFRSVLKTKTSQSTHSKKTESEASLDQPDYRSMLTRKVNKTRTSSQKSEPEQEPEQLDYRGMLKRKVQTSTAETKPTPVADQKDFRALLSKKNEVPPPEAVVPKGEAEQLDFRGVLSTKSTGETKSVGKLRSTSREEQVDLPKATSPRVRTEPPRVTQKLRDVHVKEGSSFSLQCTVTGVPMPNILWFLGNAQIKDSKFFHMMYERDVAKLEVAEVYPEDEGEYICKAENEAGVAQTTCSVFVQDTSDGMSLMNSVFSSDHGDPVSPRDTVVSPDVPDVPSQGDNVVEPRNDVIMPDLNAEQTEPPFIEDLSPDNVHVLLGDSFKLTAKFVGKPYPDIQWFKDKRQLSKEGRVNIETVGETSVLTMTDTSAEDTGKYSLTLVSELGTDSLSSSVTVEDVPDPPGQPSASNISPTSLTLSWYGSSYDGGSQVTGYKLEMCKATDHNWDIVTSTCKHTSHTVKQLEQNAEYLFRVSAGNKNGFSKPSLVSDSIVTGDRTFSPKEGDLLPFDPRTVEIVPDRKFNDHYTVGLEIGKGKFGNVFMCLEKSSGKSFAAKFIKMKASQRSEVRQEVMIMNNLHHPKLLLLWDAFETTKEIVLVMEHISGGELLERIINEDYVLTERECVHFMRQICDGINYMHDNNILHLDLKPENILCITKNSNEIKIIDFGLARKFDPKKDTRIMFGTPEFVAPEVVNYDEIGFGTDMWSVGVICYILLSGLSPFQGDNEAETFANVTMAQYDFDDDTFDEISESAKDLMEHLLVKNMRKRMKVTEALKHSWLSQDVKYMRAKRLSTDKHKRFLARRKWQKTGHAIRALGRMASLQKAMYNLGGSSGATRSRTSSTTSNESLGNITPTSPDKSLSTSLLTENLKGRMVENSVSEVPLPEETRTDLNQNEEKVSVVEKKEEKEPNAETVAPHFLKKMRDFEVFEGDSARFDVTVAGAPEPDITWCKDGHPIAGSRKYVMACDEEGIFTLIIKDCGEDDDAQYECHASNSGGDISCRAELYVEAGELDD